MDSQNPLKLLHKALSICVHSESDENCLKIAHSIRMVLIDLSERIKQALSDHAELHSAISNLLQFNANKKKNS